MNKAIEPIGHFFHLFPFEIIFHGFASEVWSGIRVAIYSLLSLEKNVFVQIIQYLHHFRSAIRKRFI